MSIQLLNRVRDIIRLGSVVKNPESVILDRLGIRRSPYEIRTADGLRLELRPGRGDRFSFFEIFVQQVYTNAGQTFRVGDTVIDVGANIGCFTLLAARGVGPSGSVLAIEPNEESFRQLQRNIHLNGLTNVIAIRAALGDSQRTITLYNGGSSLFSSTFDNVNGVPVQGESQEVLQRTLESILCEYNVRSCNYLKLDCEGAEYGILENLSPESANLIKQVTLELHYIPGHDLQQVPQRLQHLGFTCVKEGSVAYFRQN
jgi:FkbM family methyltransferase